jgi:hypothetical protein
LDCGAAHPDGLTCQDDFYALLGYESELEHLPPDIHMLMVLSYYVQHPRLYSPKGLAWAIHQLIDALDHGLTSSEIRRRGRGKVASNKRDWKVTGTPENHGSYSKPVPWTMRAADVVAAGKERYLERVPTWARSVLDALKMADEIPPRPE